MSTVGTMTDKPIPFPASKPNYVSEPVMAPLCNFKVVGQLAPEDEEWWAAFKKSHPFKAQLRSDFSSHEPGKRK